MNLVRAERLARREDDLHRRPGVAAPSQRRRASDATLGAPTETRGHFVDRSPRRPGAVEKLLSPPSELPGASGVNNAMSNVSTPSASAIVVALNRPRPAFAPRGTVTRRRAVARSTQRLREAKHYSSCVGALHLYTLRSNWRANDANSSATASGVA